MKNLWPDVFEESKKKSAKNILNEQAGLLSKLTGGLVFAEVARMDSRDSIGKDKLRDDFTYSFYIRSKFLTEYRFKVLSFSHSITFYPVAVKIDSVLEEELNLPYSVIETEEAFEELVGNILKTNRIKDVVGSLMRLARAS